MEKIARLSPTLCKSVEENDRLTQLPDDARLSIMCRLTTKEAAIFSVISHKWNKVWASYPCILNFEDTRTKEKRHAVQAKTSVSQDTRNFVRWVTSVVEQHVGPSLEEFKVTFGLDKSYQSHIDKWVVFALLKGVSSLKMEFNPRNPIIEKGNFYSMPLKCCIPLKSPHNLPNTLNTLVLSHMKMSAQVLECFLESCPFLENLRVMCVVFSSGSIRASCSLMSLKHLEVYDSQLEIIDILSPKLLTFIYHGCNIQLNIRNAYSLSDVSVGNCYQHPAYAFDSFSEYFAQLEYLHLRAYLESGTNSVISSVSNLTNLTHLKLTINAFPCQSLLGWMTLVEASPVLQKLTLELSPIYEVSKTRIGKRTSPRPLESLRTLEVYGFVGLQIDIELVTYVFGNAIFLEKAIIDLIGDGYIYASRSKVARAEAMELSKKLPLGAELFIN